MRFEIVDKNSAEAFVRESFFGRSIGYSDGEILKIAEFYVEKEEEVALSVAYGSLMIRIYDGEEYYFVCPIPMLEGADISGACEELRLYAIREDIPLNIIDVGYDELYQVTEPFRFCDCNDIFGDGDDFQVRALSELARIDGVPMLKMGDITLDAILESDIPRYLELCHNDITNRYYGYDYRWDYESADGRLYYDIIKFEEATGLALSLAIRYKGDFVGEATLYRFDYLGGASVAIRLFPEFFGKGIGSSVLSMIIELAADIDLLTLYSSVKNENIASIKMTEKYMKQTAITADTTDFVLNLRDRKDNRK